MRDGGAISPTESLSSLVPRNKTLHRVKSLHPQPDEGTQEAEAGDL